MARLADRLGRLERASTVTQRSAEAAALFRRGMLDLADRMHAAGDTQHDPRMSPRENMARALARGDFETASGIVEAAKRRLAHEGAR